MPVRHLDVGNVNLLVAHRIRRQERVPQVELWGKSCVNVGLRPGEQTPGVAFAVFAPAIDRTYMEEVATPHLGHEQVSSDLLSKPCEIAEEGI